MSDSKLQPALTLDEALARMTFQVEPGRFALCAFPEAPGPGDLALLEGFPGQLVREGGETTLLIHMDRLGLLMDLHPAAQVESGLFWVRFRADMGWEVIGFLAKVTGALAAAAVPLGAVCGYSRDHLFIHERHLSTTLVVLQQLFPATARQ